MFRWPTCWRLHGYVLYKLPLILSFVWSLMYDVDICNSWDRLHSSKSYMHWFLFLLLCAYDLNIPSFYPGILSFTSFFFFFFHFTFYFFAWRIQVEGPPYKCFYDGKFKGFWFKEQGELGLKSFNQSVSESGKSSWNITAVAWEKKKRKKWEIEIDK